MLGRDTAYCAIKISVPSPIQAGSVNFDFHQGAAVCKAEITGLPENFVEEVYGVDPIQALALAADVDPYLRAYRKSTTSIGLRGILTLIKIDATYVGLVCLPIYVGGLSRGRDSGISAQPPPWGE